jgi:diaminopimelate epimerase
VLGVYWSQKLGRNELEAYQASERGGRVGIVLTDNNRILMRGHATTILEGSVVLPQH